MRITKVKEIAGLENGEVIMALCGTVTNAYPIKRGTNDKGDWSVQNVILKDDTGEIRMSVWNQEDMKSLTGKTVTLRSSKDKHGKFTGIAAEDRDYKNITTRQVKVNYAATMSEGEPADDHKDDNKGHENGSEKNGANGHGQKPQQPNDQDPVKTARENAMRRANGVLITLGAVRWLSEEYERTYLGKELSPEWEQAIASFLSISAERAGEMAHLPTKPIKLETKSSPLPDRKPEPVREEEQEEIPW